MASDGPHQVGRTQWITLTPPHLQMVVCQASTHAPAFTATGLRLRVRAWEAPELGRHPQISNSNPYLLTPNPKTQTVNQTPSPYTLPLHLTTYTLHPTTYTVRLHYHGAAHAGACVGGACVS